MSITYTSVPDIFSDYYDPLVLLEIAERENKKIPNDRFFNDPKYQKSMEMWCAAVFGVGFNQFRGECEIKLHKAGAPDFFLKFNEQIFEFELTEVLAEGRKRGKEFKELKNNFCDAIPYKPAMGAQEGPKWIKEAIKRKIGKNYSNKSTLNLLIYANFHADNLLREKILDETKELNNFFSSIWIMTNLHVCSLYSNQAIGEINGWGLISTMHEKFLKEHI